MEHAMSAHYPRLPHGAGLIALSLAYFETFIDTVPERFTQMVQAMTGKPCQDPKEFLSLLAELQRACGVDDIRLSEWGIQPADLPVFAKNARETMGGLFQLDPRPLTDDEVVNIYQRSLR